MKNNYFSRLIKQLLLFAFFLTGIMSYSQESGKIALKDAETFKKQEVQVPSNFTATKITLSESASAEVKAAFVKTHGAAFYYTYSDALGKAVSKDEMEIALKKQQEQLATNKTLLINPKK
jgi:uncharacterized protein involved in tellurium resistance